MWIEIGDEAVEWSDELRSLAVKMDKESLDRKTWLRGMLGGRVENGITISRVREGLERDGLLKVVK